jgi:hypothetical protein
MVDIDRINESKTFLIEHGFEVYSATEADKLLYKCCVCVIMVSIAAFLVGFVVGVML